MTEVNTCNHTDAYLLEEPSPLRKARNQDEEETQDIGSTNLTVSGKIRNEIDSEFETYSAFLLP